MKRITYVLDIPISTYNKNGFVIYNAIMSIYDLLSKDMNRMEYITFAVWDNVKS